MSIILSIIFSFNYLRKSPMCLLIKLMKTFDLFLPLSKENSSRKKCFRISYDEYFFLHLYNFPYVLPIHRNYP